MSIPEIIGWTLVGLTLALLAFLAALEFGRWFEDRRDRRKGRRVEWDDHER